MKPSLFPRTRQLSYAAALVMVFAVACGDDSDDPATPEKDSGTQVASDGAVVPKPDAATSDASVTTPADAATAADAATVADAATAADAAVASDAGGADSGTAAPIPTINGCTPAMYVDKSAASGTQTIAIQGSSLSYSPKCLIVAKGTKVRWEGSLSGHPLKAGPVAGSTGGTAGSPIVETDSGTSVEFTFANAGTFPYFCTIHAPGMAGSIHVK